MAQNTLKTDTVKTSYALQHLKNMYSQLFQNFEHDYRLSHIFSLVLLLYVGHGPTNNKFRRVCAEMLSKPVKPLLLMTICIKELQFICQSKG